MSVRCNHNADLGLFVEILFEAINFASSLGEVPRILPSVIFLFIATQLFVSSR